jgi:hypothetical protein
MMNHPGSTKLLACLALAWLFPGAAGAQTPADDPERPAIKFGPLEVRPRLVFSNVGVDNNVFNERENPKSDFTLTVKPEVELAVNPGRLRLTYLSGTELVYFRKYKDERSANRSFSTRAELDLTVLKPFASYSTSHTSARAGNEIDERARRHPRQATAGTKLMLASRTSLLVSAGRRWEEYSENESFRGVSLATALNSETVAYEGSFSVALTPLTSLSLVAIHEQSRFELSPVRDANSLRIGPTLTFSPLGLLSGTASVGYRRFDGKDSALPDFTGPVASGTLGIVLGGRYRLDTAFTRDVSYSYEPGMPYYIRSGGRATLATQVAGGFEARVTAGREVLRYRALGGGSAPGPDTVDVYGAGFGYRLANRVQCTVMAEYTDRRSTWDPTREYDNNRIFATLNWGALSR